MKKQLLKRAGALFLASALVVGAVQIPALSTKAAAWKWNAQTSESGYSKVPAADLLVTADSQERENESKGTQGWAEFLADGNEDTYWHSNFSGQNEPKREGENLIENNTVTLTLASAQDIAGVTYLPRQDQPGNGYWLSFKVEVQAEGKDAPYVTAYETTEDLEWNINSGSTAYVDDAAKQEREFIFDQTYEKIKNVKFTILKTSGQNTSDPHFINAAELGVLKELELAEVDKAVLVKNAKANSEQDPPGYENDGTADWAFDGDDSHWWHSRYQGGDEALIEAGKVSEENPIWIQTGFDKVKTIGAIQYQARGNNHNIIKNYKISVANMENPTDEPSEEQWVEIQTGEFAATNDMQTVMLDKAVKATHIRLTATSFTATDNSQDAHVTAKHIKIYEVTDKRVESLQLVSQPTKTNYMLGDDFDPAGMVVKKVYEGGALGLEDITDDVAITGYDKTTVGDQEITVSYQGASAKFNVNVGVKAEVFANNQVLMDNAKANSQYNSGNDGPASYAFNGLESNWWHSNYGAATSDNVDGKASESNPIWIQTGFNAALKVAGLEYRSRSDQVANVAKDYTILAANLDDPTQDPTDEDFNQVVATGQFVNTNAPQMVNFAEPVTATHIRMVVTSITSSGNSYVTATSIRLFTAVDEMVCIRVTPPAKTQYTVGEALDTEGMKVEAIYGDGSAKDITLDQVQINGFDSTKRGTQTLTVTYAPEGADSYTAEFDVKVTKAADVQDGLVGYYTFDDENPSTAFANTVAAETEGRLADAAKKGTQNEEGVIESISQNSEDAISGKSVFIANTNKSGKTYLEIASAFKSANDTTFSFWMKMLTPSDGEAVGGTTASMFHEDTGAGTGCSIVYYKNGKMGSYIDKSDHLDTNNVTSGAWYHVVAVNSGTTGKMQFYVNGVAGDEISTNTAGFVSAETPSALMVGAHRGNNTDHYYGLLDNVRIYNRALSAEEAVAIYDIEQPRDEAEAVVVSPEEVAITSLDDVQTLTADVDPADAADPVSYTWVSDNESVIVEGNDDNTATVKAAASGYYSAQIKVTAATASGKQLTAVCPVFVNIKPEAEITVTAGPDATSQNMGTVMITADDEAIESGSKVGVGAEVAMTAAAKEGYRFVCWKDAEERLVTRDAILTVTTDEETSEVEYYAHFKAVVPDTENVAAEKKVAGVNGITAEAGRPFDFITDGKKDLNDYADFAVYGEDGKTTIDASAAIQIDLGKEYENIDYLRMIRYYSGGRIYRGTVIVISDDAAMEENANIVYNSDAEDVHGLGAGTEAPYAESQDGRIFVVPEGISGRYVTVYMHGSMANNSNHIIELEVYAPETESGNITDALKAKITEAEALNETIKDDETYSKEIRDALADAIVKAQAVIDKAEAGEEVTEEEVAQAAEELAKAVEAAYLGQGTGTYNPNIQTEYWDEQVKAGALSEQTADDIWHYQVHGTDGVWSDIPSSEFTAAGDSNNGIWGSDGNQANGSYAWGAVWRTKLTPCFQDTPYDAIAYGWKAGRGGYVKITLADTINLHTSATKGNITMSYRQGTAQADAKTLFSKTFTAGSQDVDTSDCVAITKVEAGDYLRIVAELADNDLLNVQPVITYVTAKEYAPEYLKEVSAMTWEDGTYTPGSVAAFNAAKKALSDAVADENTTNDTFEDLIAAMEAAVKGLTSYEGETVLTVSPSSITFDIVNDTRTLTASVMPAGTTATDYQWTSSEAAVASVKGEGATATVTALTNGETTITVTAKAQDGTALSAECKVTVEIPVPEDIGKIDRTVLAKNATANSQQDPASGGDGPASYAFNGDNTSWWHSRWSGDAVEGEVDGKITEENSIWLQTGFDKVRQVRGMICQARTNGHNMVKDYEIQIANKENPTDEDFETVKSGTLEAVLEPQTIMLDSAVEATHIRLVVKSVQAMDTNADAHIAIMNLDVLAVPEDGEITLKSIAATGYKSEYNVGDVFDPEGMVITATFSDESTALVSISDVKIGTLDSETAGEKKLSVNFLGRIAQLTLNVTAAPEPGEKELTGITVTPPTKTTYKVGDTLDTAGMKVTANYSDGSTEDVTSAATLSGFDSASAGTKTVTVTYEGKTATFTVTVEEEGTTPPPAEKTLESIEVTPPTKTTYKVGEELDKTGLKVTAKYSDGSTEDVTDQAVLSGFDSTAEGEQTITVTYEGKTAEFTVTVEKEGSEEPPVEKPLLRSITVTPPAKTVYKAGEALDLTGMKVIAAYSDGTTVDVTADAIVSGYDPNKTGIQTITVSYNGKTVTFTVTVEDSVDVPHGVQTPHGGDGSGNNPAVATGDNTPIGLMMTIMLLAAGVIVMTRKKRAM